MVSRVKPYDHESLDYSSLWSLCVSYFDDVIYWNINGT